MRWLSFGARGGERPGVLLHDGLLDVAAKCPHWPRTWRGLLAAGLLGEIARLVAERRFSSHCVIPIDLHPFAPPVPDCEKIVCLGRNYAAHAAEQQRQAPEVPLLFAKAPSAMIGHEATVIVPPDESRPDYEAEMALVIGRTAHGVSPETALEYLAGVTVFNDVSGREAQFGDKLWFRGKSFDTFAPIGPWVVTLDEVGDIDNLALVMRVNGEVRQQARTGEMSIDCAHIISYVSRQMALRPGDIIATGTPAGVGVFRTPPVFLQNGDVMEVELEGVGVLRNPVRRRMDQNH